MERSFLAYLRGRCRRLPQVAVGIGDDAAVIDAPPAKPSPAPTKSLTVSISSQRNTLWPISDSKRWRSI